MDVVFYAICCEFRHFFSNALLKKPLEEIIGKNNSEKVKKIKDETNNYSRKINSLSITSYEYLIDIAEKNHPKDKKRLEKEMGNSKERNLMFVSVLNSNLDKRYFVKLAKTLFESEDITWTSNYGGKSWGLICNGWLKLDEAKSLNNIMVWIDHIYNLQHNTGTVFNKLKSYSKENKGYHSWILSALEIKKHAKNPFYFINKVSPKMRELAAPALHAAGYGELEGVKQHADIEKDKITISHDSPHKTIKLDKPLIEPIEKNYFIKEPIERSRILKNYIKSYKYITPTYKTDPPSKQFPGYGLK